MVRVGDNHVPPHLRSPQLKMTLNTNKCANQTKRSKKANGSRGNEGSVRTGVPHATEDPPRLSVVIITQNTNITEGGRWPCTSIAHQATPTWFSIPPQRSPKENKNTPITQRTSEAKQKQRLNPLHRARIKLAKDGDGCLPNVTDF